MIINPAIDVTTPPLANNTSVSMWQMGVTLAETIKHLMPMIGLQIAVVLLVTFVPWVSLASVR